MIENLKNFFSDKEVLDVLKNDADYEKELESFIKRSSELPNNLDNLNIFLKEENIKDKKIFNIINETKVNIVNFLLVLEKNETSEIVLQQNIIDKIKELNSILYDVSERRKKEIEKEFIVYASNDFRSQRDKGELEDKNAIIMSIRRIKNYVQAGLTTTQKEPHHYGGGLYGKVIGNARRLIFYEKERGKEAVICVYIDAKTHNDAVNKNVNNIYRKIINKEITKNNFPNYKRINPETLEDL